MDKTVGRWARFAISVAALFIFVVGAIFHIDQMFLMALALALLPGVVWVVGRALAGGVTCARALPSLGAAGDVVPVTVALTNSARLTRPIVFVTDSVPPRLPFRRGHRLLVLNLRPGETRQVTYRQELPRRGRYQWEMVQIETPDPLGFFEFSSRCAVGSLLDVYPKPVPLQRVFWEIAAGVGGGDLESARRRGAGLDFQGVREYQPGDELRHVHWRTTARTGALSVAEYAQGASLDTMIVLDLNRAAYARLGPDAEDVLECAVTLAASACAHLARRGSSVRLFLPNEEDPWQDERSQKLMGMLERLVPVEANSDVELSGLLSHAFQCSADGQAIVCITPSGLSADGILPEMDWPASRRTRLYAMQVRPRRARSAISGVLGRRVRIVHVDDDLAQALEG
jgi:uncharacterized protein (DUF58 family)